MMILDNLLLDLVALVDDHKQQVVLEFLQDVVASSK